MRVNLTKYLPDKIHILFVALYIWSCIFYQINRFIGLLLEMTIRYIPSSLIFNLDDNAPITILRAFDGGYNDITKKLKFYINRTWDESMCDDMGGINIDLFSDYIGSGIIYIAYVFDKQIDRATVFRFDEILESLALDRCSNQPKSFKNSINMLMINVGKRVIHKLKNDQLSKEDILFGELNFH